MASLILLASCFSVSLAHTCSRQAMLASPTHSDIDRSDFCVRQASLTAASAMRFFTNGSCHLHDACSPTTPLAITTKQYPLYMRLRPGASMLLLRTRAGTQPHAYHLITHGTPNTTQHHEDTLLGRPEPFMSPLMAMRPPPFSRLHVQLFDNASAVPAVDLAFRVESGDELRAGAWFSKERLEAAKPWNVIIMKNTTFFKFTMEGYTRRKFFIFVEGTCEHLLSYMYLFKGDPHCPFDLTFSNKEYYVYAPNAPVDITISTNRKEVFEFRIRGDVGSPADPVYVRVQ